MWLEEFQELDHLVFYIFAAVSALILVLCFALMILGCVLNTRIPGGSMDFYIAFGSLAMVTTVLLRGVDPQWADELASELESRLNLTTNKFEELNIACQFYPSLLSFGLLWLIGGVLLRNCSLYGYYKGESKITRKYEWIPNLWMIFLMLIDAALVIVWLIVYKIRAEKVVGEQIYLCEGDEVEWWRLGLTAYHGFLLLLAAIMIWPAIHYTNKTFNDGDANILSVITYNLAFVATAATLLHFLYETSATGAYAINGGLILYAVLFTDLLLIIGRIMAARRMRDGAEGKYNHMDSESGRSKKSKKNQRPESLDNARNSGVYESPRNSANMHRSSGNFDY